MDEPNRQLSAIMVAGPCRKRAQRVLDALCAQSKLELMEIIVIDLTPSHIPFLTWKRNACVVYIKPEGSRLLAWGRAEGVRRASAPVVAFVEDHCYPDALWAEALIAAFNEDNWTAVGYAFTNANPEQYMGRACMFSDYGLWAYPVPRQECRLLPGNNVAYRRDALLEFGEMLDAWISPDFVVQQYLRGKGARFFLESKALAAHENYCDLGSMLGANHTYCRLLAVGRAQSQAWSRWKRVIYGLMSPLGAPAIKLFRLLRSLRQRPSLYPELIKSLPVLILVYFWSAVGEGLGYLFGKGSSEEAFNKYELEAERVKESI
jgi:hypothetical protein